MYDQHQINLLRRRRRGGGSVMATATRTLSSTIRTTTSKPKFYLLNTLLIFYFSCVRYGFSLNCGFVAPHRSRQIKSSFPLSSCKKSLLSASSSSSHSTAIRQSRNNDNSKLYQSAQTHQDGRWYPEMSVATGEDDESSSSLHDNKSWEEVINHLPTETSIDHDKITMTDKIAVTAGVGLTLSAFMALLMLAPAGSWRYFMAGGICAATSHAIPTPIDVVKVDPTLADKHFFRAVREIVKNDGMSPLWAGLGPTVTGYLLEGAVKFGIYEATKPIIKTTMSKISILTSLAFLRSDIVAYMLCGAISGIAASVWLCPMEALRIRLVSEPDFAPKGWIQGGFKVLTREGISGLTKGMNPMIFKQVPYTITKNVSFDVITRSLYSFIRAQGMAATSGLAFSITLCSALIASVLSTISSQPGDMVLSLVNAHEGQRNSRQVLQSIMQSDRGIRGFFVGFKTRMVHVCLVVTIQLLIYDYIKRLCGIAATGSV